MKFIKDKLIYILAGAAIVGCFVAASACGNETARFNNGGIDVTEHKMGNGVICYTAQLGDSVSIDCK